MSENFRTSFEVRLYLTGEERDAVVAELTAGGKFDPNDTNEEKNQHIRDWMGLVLWNGKQRAMIDRDENRARIEHDELIAEHRAKASAGEESAKWLEDNVSTRRESRPGSDDQESV